MKQRSVDTQRRKLNGCRSIGAAHPLAVRRVDLHRASGLPQPASQRRRLLRRCTPRRDPADDKDCASEVLKDFAEKCRPVVAKSTRTRVSVSPAPTPPWASRSPLFNSFAARFPEPNPLFLAPPGRVARTPSRGGRGSFAQVLYELAATLRHNADSHACRGKVARRPRSAWRLNRRLFRQLTWVATATSRRR